jgi:hypothetical protein
MGQGIRIRFLLILLLIQKHMLKVNPLMKQDNKNDNTVYPRSNGGVSEGTVTIYIKGITLNIASLNFPTPKFSIT